MDFQGSVFAYSLVSGFPIINRPFWGTGYPYFWKCFCLQFSFWFSHYKASILGYRVPLFLENPHMDFQGSVFAYSLVSGFPIINRPFWGTGSYPYFWKTPIWTSREVFLPTV